MNDVFRRVAAEIVARNIDHLAEYSADEQVSRAVAALEKFHRTTPLTPVGPGHFVDLAGFGSAAVYFTGGDRRYVLLSEAAAALGMPAWDACKWARAELLNAIEGQREIDEERGDDRLGWDCLRDHCDLGVWFTVENPEAPPDAGGRRWSDFGDWLISDERLIALILDSPWGSEFMRNASPLFGHAARKAFGEGFGALLPVDIPEDEAVKRARRGPSVPMEEAE